MNFTNTNPVTIDMQKRGIVRVSDIVRGEVKWGVRRKEDGFKRGSLVKIT